MEDHAVVITGRERIEMVSLLALKGRMRLELKGLLSSRGHSTFTIVKNRFNLRGSRENVFKQFLRIIDAKAEAIATKSNLEEGKNNDTIETKTKVNEKESKALTQKASIKSNRPTRV